MPCLHLLSTQSKGERTNEQKWKKSKQIINRCYVDRRDESEREVECQVKVRGSSNINKTWSSVYGIEQIEGTNCWVTMRRHRIEFIDRLILHGEATVGTISMMQRTHSQRSAGGKWKTFVSLAHPITCWSVGIDNGERSSSARNEIGSPTCIGSVFDRREGETSEKRIWSVEACNFMFLFWLRFRTMNLEGNIRQACFSISREEPSESSCSVHMCSSMHRRAAVKQTILYRTIDGSMHREHLAR